MLKREKLIEGRKPNYYVAASVATATDDKATYIKNKAFDDEHYKKMIGSFLGKFCKGTRKDFESLLIPKLSEVLSGTQKRAKVKSMLQAMKRDKRISLKGRIWKKI
jgi:ATP-dependent DNA helicase RecG